MCLAIPGKVKKIDGKKVTVEYPGETREVINGDEVINVGDYALVQMGVIIQKVTEKEALRSWKAWKDNS